MRSPFFSIIIPTCNSESTMETCLQSVVNQTFQDFEVYIIDANSKDNTIAHVKKYAKYNSKIKWISEKDNGIYDAMNKGIKLAKGEWLYFLGSDDELYDNEVLKKMKNNIEGSMLDVIYGNVYSKHFNGVYDGEFTNEKIFQRNICHQAIFIKKIVFKKIGIFNIRYKGFADWDHNLKWFLCKKIEKRYVDLIVAYYGETGFTSLYWDSVFGNEKQFNYLLYGRKIFPIKYKILMIKNEFMKALRLKKLRRISRLLLYAPLILLSNIKSKE